MNTKNNVQDLSQLRGIQQKQLQQRQLQQRQLQQSVRLNTMALKDIKTHKAEHKMRGY